MAAVAEPNASNARVRGAELSQLRSKYLKQDRILGPAWLIMLRLRSRVAAGRLTEVCDLVSIHGVAASNAQRCVDYLLATGLMSLAPGPGKRFRGVQMSASAYEVLSALLMKIDDADSAEREYFLEFSISEERA